MTPNDILKRYFGYDAFRGGQETLIQSILQGTDVLGVMPTGAGKSICYQVPAMLLPGITLVVSPLISLMKDQVGALSQAGIPAAYINSTLSYAQSEKALSLARQGHYKLIYVAPERLLAPGFLSFAQSVPISLMAVDEAHCISQWGQDFRPSYSQIPSFLQQLPQRPVVAAFTATATEHVQTDILHLLNLQSPQRLVTGFDRKNLYFEVQTPKKKLNGLLQFLQKVPGQSGIVYCGTRKNVEAVCVELNNAGYIATRYHAGLKDSERQKNQDDFLYDRIPIMVATNAFGMGIDKSNVSFVVHYNMPKDLESYYQEAGRAGRDGLPAHCLLLYGKGDVVSNNWMIENGSDLASFDPETAAMLMERQKARLKQMTFYATTQDCLRRFILRYFGEHPPVQCGYCSNCLGDVDIVDATVEGQKFLSCLHRMGKGYTPAQVIAVLQGQLTPELQGRGLEALSTFGISQESADFLTRLSQTLEKRHYIMQDDQGCFTPCASAREILFGGERLALRQERKVKPQSAKVKKATSTKDSLSAKDLELFQALQGVRATFAHQQGVPAFVVCSDTTLVAMSQHRPRTQAQLLDIPGIGEAKADRYGAGFLQAIKSMTPSAKPKAKEPTTFVPPTPQALAEIDLQDTPRIITAFIGQVNQSLRGHECTSLKRPALTDFLVETGYLEYQEKTSVPTALGLSQGISQEHRTRDTGDYTVNLYSVSLQTWMVAQLPQILERQQKQEES